VVGAACDALAQGPATLVGEAGAGATSVAGAVLEALLAAGTVARVAAWRGFVGANTGDAVLALGQQLDAALPGDPASLEQALREGPPPAVLLDDADLAPAVARELADLAGDTVWLCTGREPVLGAPIEVAPLPDEALAALLPPGTDPAPYRGLPLLATLPSPPTTDDPWAGLDALPAGAEVYAELPMGLPGDAEGVPGAFRLDIPGRVALRRAVREALGAEPAASATALAAALRDRLESLHRLACDQDTGHAPEDLPFLRAAARKIADPELRALAAAGAARLALRAYQPAEALAITARALRRPLPDGARGLLRWLEGDALWAQGAEPEAGGAWHGAAADLREGQQPIACAALARRCAERAVARGRVADARAWLAVSREALGEDTELIAAADTQRIAGDLAARAGELVGAEGLYDEAEAILARRAPEDPAMVGVWLGRAALAIGRGQFDAAAGWLARAGAHATDPRHRGAVAFRSAELALRRGDRDRATTWEVEARTAWRAAGALAGLALCARIRGDLAALRGDRLAARAAWDEAIRLDVRQRDLAALRRVLARVLAVEREGVPGPHLDALQEVVDLAEVLTRVQ